MLQIFNLGVPLGAFGEHVDFEARRQCDETLTNGLAVAARINVGDELAVDLQFVEAKLLQVAET